MRRRLMARGPIVMIHGICDAIIIAVVAVQASIYTVTNGSDTTAGSLHDAIKQAAAGDTVMFNIPGQDWISSPPDTIAKDIVIQGKNIANDKNISVLSVRWVFAIVKGNVRLSNMTLIGGLWGNVDRYGGVLFISGAAARVELDGVSLSEGQATYGGGMYDSASTVILNNCSISNDSSCHGGAIYNYWGNVTIFNCTINKNCSFGGKFLSTIHGINDENACGGGIYNDGNMEIRNSMIKDNFSCVKRTSGTNYIYGGAVYNKGTLTIANSSINGTTSSINTCCDQGSSDNFSYLFGGGAYNEGTLSVFNCTISGNSSSAASSQSLSYYNNVSAYVDGTGLYNHGTLVIANSTICDNSSYASTSCYIENNNVGRQFSLTRGCGIFSDGSGLIMENCTVSRNRSSLRYGGSCNGSVDSGSALCCRSKSNYLLNSLVLLNSPRDFESYNSARAINVFTGDSVSIPQKNCQNRVSPLQVFGGITPVLADNGGPTQTIAIPDFSIATGSGVLSGIYSKDTLIEGVSTTNYFAVYDEGNGWHRAENDSILPAGIQVTAFSKDQRGYVRANPPCAGAYEAGASPAIVAQGASQTSAFSFKVLSLRGNRLSVSAPYAGNYGITLFNSKGQLLEKRVATLPRGFHQMSLSHFVTRGLYVVSISGFNHKTTLDVVSKLVAIISF